MGDRTVDHQRVSWWWWSGLVSINEVGPEPRESSLGLSLVSEASYHLSR